MIEILLARLSKSKELDTIIVVTSDHPRNDELHSVIENLGYQCTRGSENDVLSRYYDAAKLVGADVVVRITADCPVIDPELVDECIKKYRISQVDYLSNNNPPTYPDGLDVEVMSFESLAIAHNEANSMFDREHVTPFIRNSDKFSKICVRCSEDLSDIRLTVDEPEDICVIRNIYEHFAPNIYFDWNEIVDLNKTHPELFFKNEHITRDEGSIIGTGQKLYKRAKKVIPGGNMLLSKRPEMFSPEIWPAYFSKAKGCRVWDLDGREYIDMSIMGIGTNLLGYGHPEVDEAARKSIENGNMSTLNCPEEVFLAEKLIEIHPWANMVRFARSGGEANSISVRIARAATGRDKVAICGYHGWHDWYLSTNITDDKNLNNHLLPGLESNGVPRGLAGTTLPFNYNDIEQLEKIIIENKGEIAAIKMEVSRNDEPKNNFLSEVRKLANTYDIVLIFDECTSGFRETFGGLHKKYNVEPDIAMFGKTLGNGYAIAAVIGKSDVMQAAQSTFISSTFWTERIGPSAALKALEVMEREKSWETVTRIGESISSRWQSLANKYELDIETWGLPALSGFTFKSQNFLSYKTLITQKLLKKGYLAANSVYACTEHKKDLIDGYFAELEPIFLIIKECEEGLDINSVLEGPICHSGFKRLN
jgi:glutamate-1-semialdehyde 2,1-aminomutase